MIERLVSFSIERRVYILVVWLAITMAAGVVARQLKLDALPDITSNQVQILTRAPGLTPEEVELRVTRKIETVLGGMPGVEQHRSLSRYGLSAITVVFRDGVDPYRARQLVGERLATVSDALPEGVDRPEIGPMTGGLGEIYHFTVDSPLRSPAELYELVQTQVVPLLRTVEGVVEVNTWGGERRTLEVQADPVRMVDRKVSLQNILESLQRGLGTLAAGALPTARGQILLRGALNPVTPSGVGSVVIRNTQNEVLRLSEVANTTQGSLPRLGAATSNGLGETVYVMVQMLSGANARDVTTAIQEKMPTVRAILPSDVRVSVVYDRSELVNGTIGTIAKSLLEGGILVSVVLFLTLGSLRAGLLVAFSIPIAMVLAFAMMVVTDLPGNLMSLGAIDFGLLVDGAVVLIENVFHAGLSHSEEDQKLNWQERVKNACVMVSRPMFFGVLVILLVYVPILALSGVDGKMFRPMALTVVFALLSALVFSLTFIPAAASLWIREKDVPQRIPRLVRAIQWLHLVSLTRVRRWPVVVSLGGVSLLVIAVVLFRQSGSELTPQLDEGDLVIQTTRNADISLAESVNQAQAMERAIRTNVPEVAQIISRVGSPAVATDIMGFEQADVFVRLRPKTQWRAGMTKPRLIELIESAIEHNDPQANPSFTQPIQMRFNELLAGAPMDVVLSVYGQDLDVLRNNAERLRDTLAHERGVEDAKVLAPEDVPMYDVQPNLAAISQSGMTVGDWLETLQALRFGVPAGQVYDGSLGVPLVVTMGTLHGRTAYDFGNLVLSNGEGFPTVLSSLMEVHHTNTPSLIAHHNGQRRLLVGFNVRGRDLGDTVNAVQKRVASVRLDSGLRITWGGQFETLRDAQERLTVVVPIVLFLIVVLLVIVFKHIRTAMIVFLHVPFAAVGGMVLLHLRHMVVSISAAVGFIALSGIAVMNGLVLVSEIVQREKTGESAANAAFHAAQVRARPVTMTALVAALGFVPMMLSSGIGSEVQKPLATVVVGGLVTSTLLTLFVLPTLYPMLQSKRKRFNSGEVQ